VTSLRILSFKQHAGTPGRYARVILTREAPENPRKSRFSRAADSTPRVVSGVNLKASAVKQDQLYSLEMRRWSLVCLLSLGIIIAYIDRTNLSVSLASADFKALFHLTDKDRGLLGSAFFWSYALLQIPAGFVVDRFGVKKPLAIGLLCWCAASAATAGATLIWQLLAMRLILGVFESVITPGAMRWIRYNIEEERRGLAMGVFMSGSKYGPAVGAPLAALLLNHYGWRVMFLVLGLGGLLWLIPWLLLEKGDDRERAAAEPKQGGASFASLFKTRVMWGTLIGTFCYNYFTYFSMTWLPAYFVERRNLSLTSMGVYTMVSFGGMATVAILAGFAADWMIGRGADAVTTRRWFVIAGFLIASTEVIGALSDSNEVAKIFAIVSLAGLGLATGNYWALTQTLLPGKSIGGIAGAQNCASNVAGAVAPFLTGWLKEATGSYDAPMKAIWVFLIIGVGCYLFLVKPATVAAR
jgi:ACS family D-galactonate transporter-like MFS transporter